MRYHSPQMKNQTRSSPLCSAQVPRMSKQAIRSFQSAHYAGRASEKSLLAFLYSFIVFVLYTMFLDFNVNKEHTLEIKDNNIKTLFKWG